MNTRAAIQKPVWINEKTTPGQVTVDGKTYSVIGNLEYPQDEQAEQNTIGSILVAGEIGKGNDLLTRIPYLHYDDFYYLRHAYIWRAMERIFLRSESLKNHQVDFSSVLSELQGQSFKGGTLLEAVGGEDYLRRLTEVVATNVETYAQTVVLRAIDRAMIALGAVISDLGRNRKMENREKIVELQTLSQNLIIRSTSLTSTSTQNLYDAVADYEDTLRAELADDHFEPGITTGFVGLDKLWLGWRKKRFYVLAAPSGWGKSAFYLCSALAALRAGKKVLYISLEMSLRELLDRIICIMARVDSSKFALRTLDALETRRVFEAMEELKQFRESKNFIIAPMMRPTLAEARAKIAEFHPYPGLDVVFVDWILDINFTNSTGKDTLAFMADIYGEFDKAAETFDIPIAAATQMNAKWEKRKGRKPEMGDLYYGPVGKFNADVIAFIYHEQYVTDDPETYDAEIITRKNRSGPMNRDASVMLKWEPEFTRFSDGSELSQQQPRQIDLGAL